MGDSCLARIRDGWHRVDDRFYVMRRLFDCDWEKVARRELVPCPHSGLFLRYRDPSPFVNVLNGTGYKVMIRQFNSISGVVQPFWCDGGSVGFVLTSGGIAIGSLSGEVTKELAPLDNSGVLLAKPFVNGVAVLTQSGTFGIFESAMGRYSVFGKVNTVKKKVVAIAFAGQTGFAAMYDRSVICLDRAGVRQLGVLSFTPESLNASPNAVNVAAISSHTCCVLAVNGKGDHNMAFKASDVAWLNDMTFLAATDKSKVHLMRFPDGQLRLDNDLNAVMLVPGFNSVRVISDSGLYIVSEVPHELRELVDNPSVKTLFDSMEKYKHGSLKAYDTMQEIDNIRGTVDLIARAVPHCYNPDHQEKLLECAIWGGGSTCIEHAVCEARLLNTIRTHGFGFSMTASSLASYGSSAIVSLLTSIGQFDCAMRASKMLGYDPAHVATQWAIAVLERSGESAIPRVLSKLDTISGVDYERITHWALSHHVGREGIMSLSAKMITPKNRIIARMALPGVDVLEMATAMWDGSAIIRALCHLKLSVPERQLNDVLMKNRIALRHYMTWKKYTEVRIVALVADRSPIYVLNNVIVYDNGGCSFGQKTKALEYAKSLTERHIQTVDGMCYNDAISRQMMLGDVVRRLKLNEKKQWTPREIVIACINGNDRENAQHICQEFHLNPGVYESLVAEAYARVKYWADFEEISKSGKSLVKPEKMIELAAGHGNVSLADRLARRLIPEDRRRVVIERVEKKLNMKIV